MRSVFLSVWLLLTCFIFPCEGVNPRPRLLIKMATRARYEQFFRTLDQYYAQLYQRIPYHFVISCDSDDPVMNSPESHAKFQTYPHLSVYYGHNKSKIEACNADIDKHPDTGKAASDDLYRINFKFWDHDENLYKSRCLNNFGLKAEAVQRFPGGS